MARTSWAWNTPFNIASIVACSIVGIAFIVGLIINASARISVLLGQNRTRRQHLSGASLLLVGYLVLIGPILAYYVVVACLFLALLVPGLIFYLASKKCIEPHWGPFLSTLHTSALAHSQPARRSHHQMLGALHNSASQRRNPAFQIIYRRRATFGHAERYREDLKSFLEDLYDLHLTKR